MEFNNYECDNDIFKIKENMDQIRVERVKRAKHTVYQRSWYVDSWGLWGTVRPPMESKAKPREILGFQVFQTPENSFSRLFSNPLMAIKLPQSTCSVAGKFF